MLAVACFIVHSLRNIHQFQGTAEEVLFLDYIFLYTSLKPKTDVEKFQSPWFSFAFIAKGINSSLF